MKHIVIIGASGHAKVVIDIVEKQRIYNIIGLIDTYRAVGEKTFDYKVIGSEQDLPDLINRYSIEGGIIAIGDNWTRKNMCERILSLLPEFKFVTAIHPSVKLGKNISIGEGTVLIPGVTVNACTKIGKHCILNSNCSIGHDAVMKDFSSLASNATLGGLTEVGSFSTIALSATLLHGIKIGKHTVIGAGSVVVKDIPSKVVAFGVPCKVIRQRKIGEKYL